MEHANSKLETGNEPFYYYVWRPPRRSPLMKGKYTELFTGANIPAVSYLRDTSLKSRKV